MSQSKIVVTGVPTKSYRLPSEWIQPNTTVVNVASFKNVDEESLLKIDGVTYVPMVGKVTVAMLERNVLRLHENYSPHAIAAKEGAKDVEVATLTEAPKPAGTGASPAASPAKDPRAVHTGA